MRPFASQIQKAQQSEKDEAAARLAENVRAATFTQLSAAIAADMKTLQNRAPTKEVEVAEQARDLKYVRERQLWLGLTEQKKSQVIKLVMIED